MSQEPQTHQISPKDAGHQDEILVSLAQAGDSAAFDCLVTRHWNKVWRLACSMLHNETAADDIAQDVFVRVFRHLHKYRGEAKFTTWLYRIAVNLVYTRTHQEAQRRVRHAEAFREMYPSQEVQDKNPEEAAVCEEQSAMVLRAIKELDPRFRQVLVLRELEGLDVAEVARILNIPEGTVKSRLFRAREDLHRVLQKYRGGIMEGEAGHDLP